MIITILRRLAGCSEILYKFDTLDKALLFGVVDIRTMWLECLVEYKCIDNDIKITNCHGAIADSFNKVNIEKDGKKVPFTLDIYLKNYGESQQFHKEILKSLLLIQRDDT